MKKLAKAYQRRIKRISKKRFKIKCDVYNCTEFSNDYITTYTGWETATTVSSAINLFRQKLRNVGINISKDNTWTDYASNSELHYYFSEEVTDEEKQRREEEFLKEYYEEESKKEQDNIYIPTWDDVDEYVNEEDIMEAKSLYEYDDNDFHLPDCNKDTLLELMKRKRK